MRHVLNAVIALTFFTDGLFAQSLQSEFQQLQRIYASSNEVWHSRHDEAKTDDESIARYREWPGWSFAPRFIAFAESAGSSDEGFESLLEVLKMGNAVGEFDKDLFNHYERAIELILLEHRDRDLRPLCSEVRFSEQSENFLRTLMTEGSTTETRADACFYLGRLLAGKREMCFPDSPAMRPTAGRFAEYVRARETDNLGLAGESVDDLYFEAIRCFERVVADYADVQTLRGDENLGARARREIYELKHLTIGAAAPDVVGADIDGHEMRLSDYRGKVVLLVFWASWCGPCMGDIPHEIELHARFAGRPFAIIGVNADHTLEAANKAVDENSIPWRSFWNGDLGSQGPITVDWNVRGWPTVYVLDHEGTIRFKNLRREELDEPLGQLVKEAESNGTKMP